MHYAYALCICQNDQTNNVLTLPLRLRKNLSVLKLVATRGALFQLIKGRLFSLAAYLQAQRISNFGIKPISIVDVGANKGQYLACLRHFPEARIYSIEPNPRAFQYFHLILQRYLG